SAPRMVTPVGRIPLFSEGHVVKLNYYANVIYHSRHHCLVSHCSKLSSWWRVTAKTIGELRTNLALLDAAACGQMLGWSPPLAYMQTDAVCMYAVLVGFQATALSPGRRVAS